ncbi:MAG: hypothetical protein COB96_05380 [Planctomycetota bacterium]|nr:MAG: hypothetical protein COB96_05380 [Planctomycetota bacterium]
MNRADRIGLILVVLGSVLGIGLTFSATVELPPVGVGDEGLMARGAALYATKCAHCHGVDGSASTSTARMLNPRPRDFSEGVIKFARGPFPQQNDLKRLIRDGIPQTSMAGFAALEEQDLDALAAYTSWLLTRNNKPGVGEVTEIPSALLASPDPASADRGAELFNSPKSACSSCHGQDLRGKGPASWSEENGWLLQDAAGLPARPRDLIADGLRGGFEAEDLYARIAFGIPGTPMAAMNTALSQTEICDLVAFLERELIHHQQR